MKYNKDKKQKNYGNNRNKENRSKSPIIKRGWEKDPQETRDAKGGKGGGKDC